MRKASSVMMIAVALSGCTLFRGSQAPDEFAVARNAPLIIPPDYGLTPPVAGTAGLSPQGEPSQASEALFGGPAPRSASETSLLDRAGRDRASLGIRSTAGDPNTRIVDKGTVTTAILNAPPSDGQVASAQVPQ